MYKQNSIGEQKGQIGREMDKKGEDYIQIYITYYVSVGNNIIEYYIKFIYIIYCI